MRQGVIAAIMIWTLTGAAGPVQGVATGKDLTQVFDIYLGGLWIAEMTIDANIGEDGYRAAAALQTKGIIGAIYKASFEAEAEGLVRGGGLATGTFRANSRDVRKSQFVEMRYQGGRPAVLRAEPAFKPKPWEIEPTEQVGTADPLSAAIGALNLAPGAPLCDRTVEIFDGRKRYAIEMGVPEENAGLIRCPALYQRVGGFKPKKMEQPDYPFEFWFEPLEDGGHRILRAMGSTPFGTAVIRQREG
ncbi:MAG: DUF3108 domain-containing protein [Pseudomonadota bacterium]